MTATTEEIIIPSSPADRQALHEGILEMDKHLTKIDLEKEGFDAAAEALEEKFGIKKKHIRAMAKDYHNDKFDEKVDKMESYSDLYEAIMKV
jgi:hypothetical protein